MENISQLGAQIIHDDHSKAVVQKLCSLCPSNYVCFNEPNDLFTLLYVSPCLPPRHLILFINSPSPLTQWRHSICTVLSRATEESTDEPAFGLGDMAGPVQRTSALQWRIETEQILWSFVMQTFFWGVGGS